jgi:protein TonB
VSFFVEPTGEITEPTVVMGINEEVDNMILELIKSMPKWTPAMYQGKAIRKKMVLPIDI